MNEIRSEIRIRAPIEKVWAHLTNSAKIAGWFLPNDFEPVVGKRFALHCNVNGRIDCEVLEIVPRRRLVYTFKPAALPFTTTVAFELAQDGRDTRLTLVHSGWQALTSDQAELFASFERGWRSRFLARLADALDA